MNFIGHRVDRYVNIGSIGFINRHISRFVEIPILSKRRLLLILFKSGNVSHFISALICLVSGNLSREVAQQLILIRASRVLYIEQCTFHCSPSVLFIGITVKD